MNIYDVPQLNELLSQQQNTISYDRPDIYDVTGGITNTTSFQDFYSPVYEPYNPEKDDSAYYKTREFETAGAKKIKEGITTPSLLLNVGTKILSKPLQTGSITTRKYFREDVLGKGAYKTTSQAEFDAMSRAAQESLYKGYITGRTSGKTDAYGRDITSTGRDGGNGGGAIGTSGQVVQAPQPVTSPTTAEVSQATAAQQEDITLRKKKVLARGRSPTIMTGVTGATGSLTLGKPSLLGR